MKILVGNYNSGRFDAGAEKGGGCGQMGDLTGRSDFIGSQFRFFHQGNAFALPEKLLIGVGAVKVQQAQHDQSDDQISNGIS